MRMLVWHATKQLGVSQNFINLQASFSCFVCPQMGVLQDQGDQRTHFYFFSVMNSWFLSHLARHKEMYSIKKSIYLLVMNFLAFLTMK